MGPPKYQKSGATAGFDVTIRLGPTEKQEPPIPAASARSPPLTAAKPPG